MLEFTPYSERYFAECRKTIDDGSPLERAIKFQVVVQQSQAHTDSSRAFSVHYTTSRRSDPPGVIAPRVRRLSDRLRYVQLLDRPALDILERTADVDEAVVYCDPPYRTADTTPYTVVEDSDLIDVLRRQRGRVAISGYGSEWEALGWHRHEFDTFFSALGSGVEEASERTEVLWTNYEPDRQVSLL